MNYFELEPEVPCHWGPNTVRDVSTHPPIIYKLHAIFDGWLGDDLLTTFPVYLVTPELADFLAHTNLSGFELRECEVEKSELFSELYPGKDLPEFKWLFINGTSSQDFFISAQHENSLCVSEQALDALKKFNLSNCIITSLGEV